MTIAIPHSSVRPPPEADYANEERGATGLHVFFRAYLGP